jgi:hypothetical protein
MMGLWVEPITWDGEKGMVREIFSLQITATVIIYRYNVVETVENPYGLKPVLLDHGRKEWEDVYLYRLGAFLILRG